MKMIALQLQMYRLMDKTILGRNLFILKKIRNFMLFPGKKTELRENVAFPPQKREKDYLGLKSACCISSRTLGATYVNL